jgi:Tfp pilus assembly protein PilX
MMNNRGIALFIVLGMFFIVILLGNVVIGIMSNQARLTHHSVSRTQAYYAAQAATILAYERLRTGSWPIPASNTNQIYYLCRQAGSGCDVVDSSIPGVIANSGRIMITVWGQGGSCQYPMAAGLPANAVACVTATADYTYP